jgi:hypothetical protein
MKPITWKRLGGRIYITTDQRFMIKNVGPRCWGVFINDDSEDWDINWVGSTYPTLRSAMDSRMVQNA